MILPKPILQEIGVATGATMELTVENGRVIATPVKHAVREGWATDAAIVGAEVLTESERGWIDFGNEGDDELVW